MGLFYCTVYINDKDWCINYCDQDCAIHMKKNCTLSMNGRLRKRRNSHEDILIFPSDVMSSVHT